MRLVKFDNGIMIAFAVNIATRMRSAFLSVTSEAPKSRFPHWKAVSYTHLDVYKRQLLDMANYRHLREEIIRLVEEA